MKSRRNFFRTSALSIFASPFILNQKNFFDNLINEGPMVRQPEDSETFFVRPNTPITFNISKLKDNISSVSLLTEELMPGSVIPVHKHLNEDEFFIFLSGSGSISVDDSTFTFKSGTTGFVPRNTWHGLKNTGTEKLIFTFGYLPGGFEDFFRQVGTPKGQEFKPKPKEEFDMVCKKYGMVFK